LNIPKKTPFSLLGPLHLSKNKGWRTLILGISIGLSLMLLVYVAWLWNASNNTIQFTPADVIYGVKIHAVHAMGADPNIRNTGSFTSDPNLFPEIRLSEQFYDFGEVKASQVLTRTFIIANEGQSTLLILRAYTTCGCTTADITSAEIPPGKVALITLQFDTGYHDMRGTTVRRGVMLETNDPHLPTQEIWIQASVR
jgi:hypothetical protein